MSAAYQFIDLTPKGRDETVEGDPQFWVRRHDESGSLPSGWRSRDTVRS